MQGQCSLREQCSSCHGYQRGSWAPWERKWCKAGPSTLLQPPPASILLWTGAILEAGLGVSRLCGGQGDIFCHRPASGAIRACSGSNPALPSLAGHLNTGLLNSVPPQQRLKSQGDALLPAVVYPRRPLVAFRGP